MSQFPRIRTLFQSLDTARYHKKFVKENDPSIARDVALARAEVLGAMLFGHQIVVPAGAIADCPAFKLLLKEVNDGAEEHRRAIDQIIGVRYSPFVVGLEKKYESEHDKSRYTGYDHFVFDYLGSYAPGKVDLSVISMLGEKGSERSQDEDLVLVGNAFLKGEFEDVYDVSESFGDHSKLVLQEFSDRSEIGAGKIFSEKDDISGLDANVYLKTIEDCVLEAEKRRKSRDKRCIIEYPRLADVSRLGLNCFNEIVNGKYPRSVNTRGAWYLKSNIFEDHWPAVRNWLDHRLNCQFMSTYKIALPSYFTQSLALETELSRLALVYMDPNQADGLDQSDRPNGVPVTPDVVVWTTVWELLSNPKIQNSIKELQTELCRIYEVDRREGPYQLRMRKAADPAERYELEARHAYRVKLARAAIEKHLEAIQAAEKGLAVKRTKPGIEVSVTRRVSAGKVKDVAATAMVGGTLFLDAVKSMVLPSDTSTFDKALLTEFLTKLTMKLPTEAVERVADWTTRRLYGTTLFDNDIAKGFGLSEVDRVSYWTVPNAFVAEMQPSLVINPYMAAL